MEDTGGLKTLHKRISQIESNLSKQTPQSSGEQLLNNISCHTKNNKIKRMNELQENFENFLYQSLDGVNPKNHISRVVQWCILFVEENINLISSIINEEVSSYLKKNTALNLLQNIGIANDITLQNIIDHMCELIFQDNTSSSKATARASTVPPPKAILVGPTKEQLKRRKSVSFFGVHK